MIAKLDDSTCMQHTMVTHTDASNNTQYYTVRPTIGNAARTPDLKRHAAHRGGCVTITKQCAYDGGHWGYTNDEERCDAKHANIHTLTTHWC